MMPSLELRLQTMTKAMAEVILPAIAPENALAREQAQLVIAQLGLVAKHWRRATEYEALELRAIRALAARLVTVATGGAETRDAARALEALLHERDPRPAGAVDAERAAIARAIDALMRASEIDGDETFDQASSEAILEYSALDAWRGRVWFSACGMDPERAELPEIDDLLASANPAPHRVP